MTFNSTILVSAGVFTGLMAGLFFAYSCSVVLGLKNLPDLEYIRAMQSINKAIQNPLFFLVFFGCLVLMPLCCYLYFSVPLTNMFWLLLAATLIYFVGVFGTTVIGNVPLNENLGKFNLLTATNEAAIAQRAAFEDRWNLLNNIRTLSSILSFVLMVIACLHSGKE